jgi:outer membrane biogenesis lipoprotein LolB
MTIPIAQLNGWANCTVSMGKKVRIREVKILHKALLNNSNRGRKNPLEYSQTEYTVNGNGKA